MTVSVRVWAASFALAAFAGTADAAIIELQMSSPVNATTHTSVHPYMQPGDIATLTVRYDTDAPSSGVLGSSTLYKNAITYFGFELERGGVTTYSGSVSGNFGQISISDNSGTSPEFDNITFRIFDDWADYPSGTRNGANPAPAILPLYATGDPTYGDLFFHDFRMHFLTVDNTVLTSEALPTLSDLTVMDVGSPFGPHNGNTPWSGFWEFENRASVLGGLGSFGSGAPRDNAPLNITFSVSEFTGDVSEAPLPASLPLFAAGFAGLAGLRLKKKKRQGSA